MGPGKSKSSVRCPTVEQLRSLNSGDMLLLTPPTSKPDPTGAVWASKTMSFEFHPNAPINVARAMRDMEISYPIVSLANRKRTPLFTVDRKMSPLRHHHLEKLLPLVLENIGVDESRRSKLSWHSFRIWLACALKANNHSKDEIMALCRWASPQSVDLYARMNEGDYAYCVARAMEQTVDSTMAQTINMVDEDAWWKMGKEAAQACASMKDDEYSDDDDK